VWEITQNPVKQFECAPGSQKNELFYFPGAGEAQSKSSSGFGKIYTALVPSRQVLQWLKLLKLRLNNLNTPPGSQKNEFFYFPCAGGAQSKSLSVFSQIYTAGVPIRQGLQGQKLIEIRLNSFNAPPGSQKNELFYFPGAGEAQSKSSSGFGKIYTALVPSRQVVQCGKLLKIRLNSLNAPPGSQKNELFYLPGAGEAQSKSLSGFIKINTAVVPSRQVVQCGKLLKIRLNNLDAPQALRKTSSSISRVGAQSKSLSGFIKINTAVVQSRQVVQCGKLLKFRLNNLDAPQDLRKTSSSISQVPVGRNQSL